MTGFVIERIYRPAIEVEGLPPTRAVYAIGDAETEPRLDAAEIIGAFRTRVTGGYLRSFTDIYGYKIPIATAEGNARAAALMPTLPEPDYSVDLNELEPDAEVYVPLAVAWERDDTGVRLIRRELPYGSTFVSLLAAYGLLADGGVLGIDCEIAVGTVWCARVSMVYPRPLLRGAIDMIVEDALRYDIHDGWRPYRDRAVWIHIRSGLSLDRRFPGTLDLGDLVAGSGRDLAATFAALATELVP